MRRTTVVLASTLSLLAAAVVFVLLGRMGHYGSEPRPGEAKPAVQPSPTKTEPDASTVVPPPLPSDPNRSRTVGEAVSNTDHPGETTSPESRPPPPDENTIREWVRRQAAQDVEVTYSLLVEHLGLTVQEKAALLSLLVEIQVEGTSSYYYDKVILSGRRVDKDDRLNRIAAVIGDSKLQRFLALERDLRSYSEVGRIGAVLRQNGASLTDTQRDGLFRILVDVRNQSRTGPPAGIEADSIEAQEYRGTQRSEFERHVVELAPSVLAPDQVVYLDQLYQRLSYQRANDLEIDRKARAQDPHFPLTGSVWD